MSGNVMKECYVVEVSYTKEDGTHVYNQQEVVVVDSNDNPGANHEAAQDEVRERFPGCTIHSSILRY